MIYGFRCIIRDFTMGSTYFHEHVIPSGAQWQREEKKYEIS